MEETLSRLQRQYKRFRLSVMLFIPLLAGAAISAFFNRYLTMALLAAAVAYQLLYLRRLQKRYQDGLMQENIRQTVCARLGTDQFDPLSGGAIQPATIISAKLVPFDDGAHACLLRQGVSGQLEGLPVDLCDATFAETFRLVDKGRRRVHFNSGCWIRVKLPSDTGCDWRLLDIDAVPTLIRRAFFADNPHLEKAPLDGSPLDSRFFCYRAVDNPKMPGAKLLRQLEKLADYTPGKVAVSLRGDTVSIFVRGRFLARPASMKSAPTRELIEFDPFPELAYALRIAKAALQADS